MKAVFFDIDGTLIEGTHPDYRYMRENVQKAIRKLQEQGHYVFIASGRSLAFLDEKIRNFGFDGYVLLNGSVIFFHDKIIYRAPLEKSFVEKITSICDEHDMQYSLQGDFHTYVDKKFEYLIYRLGQYGIFADQLTFDYDKKAIDVYKLEIDSPRHEDRKYIIENLPEDMTYVEDMNHNYCHLEVYAKENSKATGALKVLELLNIDIKDSYAFGDGFNDVCMFKVVGHPIAMGNGVDVAKEASEYITSDIYDGGIYKALLHYGIIE